MDDFTQSTLQVHKGSMGGLSKKRTPLLWKTLSAFIKTVEKKIMLQKILFIKDVIVVCSYLIY